MSVMTLKAMLAGRQCDRSCGRPAARVGAGGSRLCDHCKERKWYDTTADRLLFLAAAIEEFLNALGLGAVLSRRIEELVRRSL